MNIVIIHYNTPELTLAAVKSVRKYNSGCKFYIFDNSDKSPFIPDSKDDIILIDNTKGQVINFNKIKEIQQNYKIYKNNTAISVFGGSAMHIISVDWFFDYILDEFLLLDSDVLAVSNFSNAYNTNFICCGQISRNTIFKWQNQNFLNMPRLFPTFLFINVKLCKKYNIRFKHPFKIWKFSFLKNILYDTGGSFLEDILLSKQNIKKIKRSDYIIHFGSASYVIGKPTNQKYELKKMQIDKWLDINKKYYE